MKCSKCRAPLDNTDCFCPSCGKKNPLVAVNAHSNVLFHLHLDDDIEVKEAGVPEYTVQTAYPKASYSAARDYSTPLSQRSVPTSAGSSSSGSTPKPNGKSLGCFVYIILLLATAITILAQLN